MSEPERLPDSQPRLSDDVLETSRLVVELLQAAYSARRATPGLAPTPGPDDAAGPREGGEEVESGEGGGQNAAADGGAQPRAPANGEMGPHAARVAIHVYRYGSRTVGQLAEGLGISYGWASRIVETLEAAKIVRRERDGADRRVVHVRLEPAAIEMVERAYRWHGDAVAEALDPLSERERRAVREFLSRLAASLRQGAARAS